LTVPIKERFFEDYWVGETLTFGDTLISEAQIIEFASRYDPQAFHLDQAAAAQSVYGGLIASGWMTGSLMMRMTADHFISPKASMGSPGIDEVRWLKPVRPGDRLKVRVTIIEARRSSSKPDRGIVRSLSEAINQHDDVVMSFKGMGMYRCRAAA
jgi:acyl dehydratase